MRSPSGREQAQPIPNAFLRVETGYNWEVNLTTVGVQYGWNFPIWNRNQGTVREAMAEVAAGPRRGDPPRALGCAKSWPRSSPATRRPWRRSRFTAPKRCLRPVRLTN